MAKLKDLEKYLNYKFSTGCYTGEDYKTFERKYINYLKSLCKEKGWELVWAHKSHYNFTACFSFNGKFIYFSISDVRFGKNEWYYHILYRTMKHEKDYTGGANCYIDLPTLEMLYHQCLQGWVLMVANTNYGYKVCYRNYGKSKLKLFLVTNSLALANWHVRWYEREPPPNIKNPVWEILEVKKIKEYNRILLGCPFKNDLD